MIRQYRYLDNTKSYLGEYPLEHHNQTYITSIYLYNIIYLSVTMRQ